MYKEFAKKVMRRRASKFIGTFIADSLTVRSKWSLTTYPKKKKNLLKNDSIKSSAEFAIINYKHVPSLSRLDS